MTSLARAALATLFASGLVVGMSGAGIAQQQAGFINDYPTNTRADYVFGCMAVNGDTREALERCSCSIDLIASILPYDDYVNAETVLMVEKKGGENTSIFRTSPMMRGRVDKLRRAQAEAEIRCF